MRDPESGPARRPSGTSWWGVLSRDERLASALSAGRVAVVDWDLTTGLVSRSPNMSELFGVPLASRSHQDDGLAHVHPEDREPMRRHVQEALTSGKDEAAWTFRFLRADGSVSWAEFRGTVQRDAEGRPVRILAVVANIDERKRAESAREEVDARVRRSERRLRTLIENTPLAVVEWDRDLRIAGWSGIAEKTFGWTAAEMIGRTVEDSGLVYTEDVGHVRAVSARLTAAADAYLISHNRNWTKDGRVLHCVWYNSIFRDESGETESTLSLVLDVTRQVVSEEERSRLVDALRSRADELAESGRQKDRFIALLAHELRNPLAPLQTSVQILKRSPSEAQREAAIARMERQLGQMVRLVDDLLDAGRITTGKLRLVMGPVRIAELVTQAVEAVRESADARGLELSFELAPSAEGALVTGDPARLSQIVSNLLDNALKFTPRGGRVSVSLRRRQDQVVLTVADTGPGIPADRLVDVFESFVQLDAKLEKAHGGLGLGLTVVRELVQRHGGTVHAESDGPGTGSTFVVTLPVSPAAVPAEEPGGVAPDETPRRRRILVVDDNVDSAQSLGLLLEMLGQEVETAYDGERALAAFERRPPALVLCDIGMPRMSGYEVARRMRLLDRGREVRLVALTGYGGATDRAQALAAGFDDHVVKPLDVADLERILGGAAATR